LSWFIISSGLIFASLILVGMIRDIGSVKTARTFRLKHPGVFPKALVEDVPRVGALDLDFTAVPPRSPPETPLVLDIHLTDSSGFEESGQVVVCSSLASDSWGVRIPGDDPASFSITISIAEGSDEPCSFRLQVEASSKTQKCSLRPRKRSTSMDE